MRRPKRWIETDAFDLWPQSSFALKKSATSMSVNCHLLSHQLSLGSGCEFFDPLAHNLAFRQGQDDRRPSSAKLAGELLSELY